MPDGANRGTPTFRLIMLMPSEVLSDNIMFKIQIQFKTVFDIPAIFVGVGLAWVLCLQFCSLLVIFCPSLFLSLPRCMSSDIEGLMSQVDNEHYI